MEARVRSALRPGTSQPSCRAPPLPLPPPAAAGKKKGRKRAAGGGGLLGALGLKKGERASAEEEPPGAGTPGSPRYIQVCAVAGMVAPWSGQGFL